MDGFHFKTKDINKINNLEKEEIVGRIMGSIKNKNIVNSGCLFEVGNIEMDK